MSATGDRIGTSEIGKKNCRSTKERKCLRRGVFGVRPSHKFYSEFATQKTQRPQLTARGIFKNQQILFNSFLRTKVSSKKKVD